MGQCECKQDDARLAELALSASAHLSESSSVSSGSTSAACRVQGGSSASSLAVVGPQLKQPLPCRLPEPRRRQYAPSVRFAGVVVREAGRQRTVRSSNGNRGDILMLQFRDVSPEDYELLNTLDDLRSKKNPRMGQAILGFPMIAASEAQCNECQVCLDAIAPELQVPELPCGHAAFHRECITRWLMNSERCPICRASVLVDRSRVGGTAWRRATSQP
mmetsp:Transcript_23041/g.41612  ORF Transcript_23041/g.41612 Transcript_23041/m.41612 type:complete len:218 (+) Transcript_23041:76-729(+)|eukprot:CAMPEP_0197632780 /NCGR_PEP_ID=MMETSP1338-20131121/9363_1 /TAXON_ID=43686 ORGANISM="Pelagodinium beii, Strain RCC1491" /NCGR_SAMPLE_ID=MMETSP1338 /ASSEMBLY_ACC=CAM_ASM_000754 /LENGTH=217 /DNA_ID=CAMNT_0043204351 /DNA_START=76 /DNA_END=729 /DNA_ORIENTATION=+